MKKTASDKEIDAALLGVMGEQGISEDQVTAETFRAVIDKLGEQETRKPDTLFRAWNKRRAEQPKDAPLLDQGINTMIRAEISAQMQEAITELSTLLDSKIKDALGSLNKLDKNVIQDEPALPPKTGKKFTGSKDHLHIRVDAELIRVVGELARERYAGNVSRAAEVALWRGLGRPTLSHELEADGKDSEDNAT